MSNNLKKSEDWFLYYAASPYSHPDPSVKKLRYDLAVRAAKAFTRLKYSVFVPIAYDGLWDLDPNYSVDHSWNFWERIDLPILDRCSACLLLQFPDWEKSQGVKAELEHCDSHGIPVMAFTLEDLNDEEVINRKMKVLQGMIKRNRRVQEPKFQPRLMSSCGVSCNCDLGECKQMNCCAEEPCNRLIR